MDFINEFEHLKRLSLGKELEDIDIIFQKYIDSIYNYLKLEPVHKNVRIHLLEKENLLKEEKEINPFDIGVARFIQDKILHLEISQKYTEFLPYILLREAYYIFLPKRSVSVEIAVNSFIEKDLQDLDEIGKWQSMIRECFIHDDSVSKIMTAFEKLHLEVADLCKIFFNMVRNNISLIDKDMDDLVTRLQEEIMSKLSKIFYNDEMVETLRVLIEIFYRVKQYTALLNYQEHFKIYKEKNIIKSDLSLRKFTSNMKLISNNSLLSPSYLTRWNTIDVFVCFCYMRFHPKITVSQINRILKTFPFFLEPRTAYSSGFCPDIFGFFILPRVYFLDFIGILNRMKNNNYLTKLSVYRLNYFFNFANLNFLRSFHKYESLINPFHNQYDIKFEINYFLNYGENFHQKELDLLDFLILDRIRFFSTNSFGFERRANTLTDLKKSIIEEVTYQRNLIIDIKELAKKISEKPKIKSNFLKFLDTNQTYGLFYIKNVLDSLLTILIFIEIFFIKNPNIKNTFNFKEWIKKHGLSNLIESNLFLKKKFIKTLIFNDFVPLYFNSKEKFKEKLNEYKIYNQFIDICFNLKTFNLKVIKQIVENPETLKKVYEKKELKLKEIYEIVKLTDITSKEVEERIAGFLKNKPPIIEPWLLNTLGYLYTNIEDLVFIIKNDEETLKKLNLIKKFFPFFIIFTSTDLISNEDIIFTEVSFPNFHYRDAYQFYSILYNTFKENLLIAKRYLSSGFTPVFSLKSFYNFETRQFFYTKDLFKQFFHYIQKTLGENFEFIPIKDNKILSKLLSKENNMFNLVKTIKNRQSRDKIDYKIKNLKKLIEFNLNLDKSLKDLEKYKEIKQETFFKKYVNSIRFIPSFQHFGFDQFFLYIFPIDMSKIDLKLLFLNNFQQIKCSSSIDAPNPLLIKYIMPNNTPNDKYLHWLVKSMKVIQEYSLFSVKKIYSLLHFDYNLAENGWEYDADKFKSHLENILFKSGYEIEIPKVREFNISKQLTSSYYDPKSEEYETLTKIYGRKSLDMKSYLGTRNYKVVNSIKNLLNKKLIFPYLSLKNLGFQDKLLIILPNIKSKSKDILLQIFSYFNYGFIYEIEGEFYIYGFDKEVKFEEGLMIKLYLPKSKFSMFHKFLEVFNLLFEYLEIPHYLFLYDLVNSKELIKSVYGNIQFLKQYNPLKNLKWNKKDKIWLNHKVFTQKFEPIYPDLLYNKEDN